MFCPITPLTLQINAMVLVPRDEDMIRRSEQRTLEEGKEVPESAVLEMKANFSIPHENEGLFDKITFLELQRQEAQELVEQYNRWSRKISRIRYEVVLPINSKVLNNVIGLSEKMTLVAYLNL